MTLYFTFEFCNCLHLFSTPMAKKHIQPIKYIMPAFNSKQKYWNISCCHWRSTDYAELGHFTLIYDAVLQIKAIHNACAQTFCLYLVAFSLLTTNNLISEHKENCGRVTKKVTEDAFWRGFSCIGLISFNLKTRMIALRISQRNIQSTLASSISRSSFIFYVHQGWKSSATEILCRKASLVFP